MKNFLFKNKTTAQTIAKNTFWLVTGETISRFARAIVIIYAFRVLGAAGYGAFSFAMAISNFAAIFGDLGVTSIIGREVSKDRNSKSHYFSNALALKTILLGFNICIILFIIPSLVKIPETLPLLPLIAMLLIFDTLRDFCMVFFRALEHMEWDALVKIIMNLVIGALGFYWLKTIGTTIALTHAYIIGTAIGLGLAVVAMLIYSRDWLAPIDRRVITNIAVLSWPIGLLGIAGAFSINTDMIMLGWMASPVAVGLYAAAQRPILLLYVLPNLLASAMFPVMARLANVDNARLGRLAEQGSRITFLMALPLTVGGIILAPQLMPAIFGATSIGAVTSFQILLLTFLIVFPFAMINNTILAHNKQSYFVRFFLLGAATNIIFNLLLIPRFGIAGASVATVLSQLVANALTLRAVKKLSTFSITRGLSRILLATGTMGAISWILSRSGVPVLLTLGVSAIAYLLFLIALREPLLRDMRQIFRPAISDPS